MRPKVWCQMMLETPTCNASLKNEQLSPDKFPAGFITDQRSIDSVNCKTEKKVNYHKSLSEIDRLLVRSFHLPSSNDLLREANSDVLQKNIFSVIIAS